jgi:transposase
MKLLYRRCAALDLHKKTICACIREVCGKQEVHVEEASFGTMTHELVRLGMWLKMHKVKRVAMESTGVYWIPVWNVLEQKRFGLELMLVNPAQVKALPGQKTDPKDAARIAELHQYGLLRGSFIPPTPIRELRDLVRRRAHLQQEKNRIINRIAGLLECANVKLGSVASNIVGVSGTRMLHAMAKGETNAERLSDLAVGSLQNKKEELKRALEGQFDPHFRFLLGELLEDLSHSERKVSHLEERIRAALAPHGDVVARLCTIPTVEEVTAWTILAEIGLDMSAFASGEALASWAGLCPGNEESAGKRRSGRVRKGNRYLRRTLIQNAWAVSHSKDCFLTSLFLRIARRRGMKRAAMAVAHRILIIAFHILRDQVVYRELGGSYHDRLHPVRTARRLIHRLNSLGYKVDLAQLGISQEILAALDPRGRPLGSKKGRGSSSAAQSSPADPNTCSKCAKWGIPCIHARNRIHRHSNSAPQHNQ